MHGLSPDGLPPLPSAHLAAVLAVFTTALSPGLMARIELDADVAAARTLAVAFPLMRSSLQVRARGGGICAAVCWRTIFVELVFVPLLACEHECPLSRVRRLS